MIKINLLKVSQEKNSVKSDNKDAPLKDKINSFLSNLKNKNDDESENSFEEPVSNVEVFLKFIIIVSGLVGLYYYEQERIPQLEDKLHTHQKNLQELKSFNGQSEEIVAEIKKMKDNKISIEKQIESIGGLSKLRMRYIKAMDILQQNIPEKMWFTGIKTDQIGLIIDGIAFSEAEISTYIDLIGKSVHFADVLLLESTDDLREDSQGKRLRKFRINAKLEKE